MILAKSLFSLCLGNQTGHDIASQNHIVASCWRVLHHRLELEANVWNFLGSPSIVLIELSGVKTARETGEEAIMPPHGSFALSIVFFLAIKDSSCVPEDGASHRT
jgi:hypothetical protein